MRNDLLSNNPISNNAPARRLLQEIRACSPLIDRVLDQYGDTTLQDYAAVLKPAQVSPLQPREDFLQLQDDYLRERLGEETAQGVARAMDCPLINAANHHGVDYFAQSVQSNILYWQCLKAKGLEITHLPIHAFSLVPLGNASYARGMLAYGKPGGLLKIPLFPEKLKPQMVSQAAAFSKEQALALRKKVKAQTDGLTTRKTMLAILEEVYLQENVLAQERYADQALLINRELNRRMFPGEEFPAIVTIETDKIAAWLLLKDLNNPGSLLARVLGEPQVVRRLLHLQEQGVPYVSSRFFLGVDEAGRGYGLDMDAGLRLRGRTLAGEVREFAGDIQNLSELARCGRIVPSGLTMALMLALARGYTWLGGCFMGNYLPAWQEAFCTVLSGSAVNRPWVEEMQRLDCRGYISGPIFALQEAGRRELVCAGPLEIIEAGGIPAKRLQELLQISMAEAHEAGLFNLLPDFRAGTAAGWWQPLGRELYERYGRYKI